jgi:hypothetical protein
MIDHDSMRLVARWEIGGGRPHYIELRHDGEHYWAFSWLFRGMRSDDTSTTDQEMIDIEQRSVDGLNNLWAPNGYVMRRVQ